MKLTHKIPMPLIAAGETRLVVGRTDAPIEAGAVMLLVKLGPTDFELRVVSNSKDETDPLSVAAFIAPEAVEAMELQIAAALANPKPKPGRKPRSRKAVTR